MTREVTGVRIVQRTTFRDRREVLKAARPFSEVFIATADGGHYYTRLFHTLADSPHARAAQTQDFLRRMEAADRAG